MLCMRVVTPYERAYVYVTSFPPTICQSTDAESEAPWFAKSAAISPLAYCLLRCLSISRPERRATREAVAARVPPPRHDESFPFFRLPRFPRVCRA